MSVAHCCFSGLSFHVGLLFAMQSDAVIVRHSDFCSCTGSFPQIQSPLWLTIDYSGTLKYKRLSAYLPPCFDSCWCRHLMSWHMVFMLDSLYKVSCREEEFKSCGCLSHMIMRRFNVGKNILGETVVYLQPPHICGILTTKLSTYKYL